MKVDIVPAVIADFNTVLDHGREVFGIDAWSFLDMASVFCSNECIRLKALCDGKFAGFAASELIKRYNEREAWVMTLSVQPEYRGYGVGKMLLSGLQDSYPGVPFYLCADAENEAALHLYHGCGYKNVERLERYYPSGKDALVLVRQIEE